MKLVIAEKKSVAESISAVLNAKKREDGFFIGSTETSGEGYIITWCMGHLVELAAADAYNEAYAKWRYVDLPIIPEIWKHEAPKSKVKQLKIIAELMKRTDVDTIVCATDAGREGEHIFRLVYDYCKCKKPIERLWISSMEEKAIVEGMRNLHPGTEYEGLYQAALCRAQADWLVGINATRLFSTHYGSLLNIGRVITPTLAMIVERDNQIATFTKEPFYTVDIDCGEFIASGNKTKDKQTAEGIKAACDGKNAVVTSIAKQEKSVQPPKLYDLTTLQREANRMFGFTSQQTLDYAQSLYEKKLATYPRTDARYLTGDMAGMLPALVESVAHAVPFTEKWESIDTRRVINDSKVSDHHAIIPTMSMAKQDLSALLSGERDILLMLSARLICALSENHTYSETSVIVDCEGNSFSAKGKIITKDGWKSVEQAFKDMFKNKSSESDTTDGNNLPVLTEGQTFDNVCAKLREGFTSPPKHFTEDTLLSAMETAGDFSDTPDVERRGIGTPATRSGIIEKMVKSEFVERKAKQLIATDKAKKLITVLPEMIKSPELTAEWENKLKKIERKELTATAFMSEISKMTTDLVKSNTAPNPEFLSLFPAPTPKGEPLGKCPRCNNDVYEKEKGFFCLNRACSFALWKESKFFTSKKKTLTAADAAALLKNGHVKMNGLFSEKTGKTYDATVILDDTGDKYVNFKLNFEQKGAKR